MNSQGTLWNDSNPRRGVATTRLLAAGIAILGLAGCDPRKEAGTVSISAAKQVAEAGGAVERADGGRASGGAPSPRPTADRPEPTNERGGGRGR